MSDGRWWSRITTSNGRITWAAGMAGGSHVSGEAPTRDDARAKIDKVRPWFERGWSVKQDEDGNLSFARPAPRMPDMESR